MSAILTKVKETECNKITLFQQTSPIAMHHIALVVGNLRYIQTDPRISLIADPTMITAAINEFAELGSYVDATDEYMGTSISTDYTFLVMPPSFPYGAIENPMLI